MIYKQGYTFPIHIRIFGIFLIINGLFPYEIFPWNMVLLIPGLFVLIGKSSTKINLEEDLIIKENDFLIFKSKERFKLSSYPALSILKKKMIRRTYGGRTSVLNAEKLTMYDVVLLSSNHIQKIILQRFETPEDAKKFALEQAAKLPCEFMAYQPRLRQSK